MDRKAGFTLIETVCGLAIVALLAAIILPAIPRATTRTRLAGYAVEIAALLKGDRNAAMRRNAMVATMLDVDRRTVRSGQGAATVEVPQDVSFSAMLAERCNGRPAGSTIDFFPTGASCGGAIAIARQGLQFQIRVNWLTGAVDVVAIGKS
jgi:general secretion pathway protein H